MSENKLFDAHKSSLGMDANKAIIIFYAVAAVLAIYPYTSVVAFIVPLIFFLKEKNSDFVKFHAFQCMLYNIVFAVIDVVLAIFFMIPMIPDDTKMGVNVEMVPLIKVAFVPFLPGLIFLCLAALCIVKGNSYEAYKLPIFGPIAEKKCIK